MANLGSALAGMGGSLLSIHLANKQLEQQYENTMNYFDEIEELYKKNSKAVHDAYTVNWYRENFRVADERQKLIKQSGIEKGDFISQVVAIRTAYDLAGSSFVNDAKTEMDDELKETLDVSDFNHSMILEQMNDQELANIQALGQGMVQQAQAADSQLSTLVQQTEMNNLSQFFNFVSTGVGIGYDYYSNEQSKQPSTGMQNQVDINVNKNEIKTPKPSKKRVM